VGLTKAVAHATYELCFQCSRYHWKAKLITFPTQLVPHQNMFGSDGNHRNKMTSRICQKPVGPIFGSKGLYMLGLLCHPQWGLFLGLKAFVHPRVAQPPLGHRLSRGRLQFKCGRMMRTSLSYEQCIDRQHEHVDNN
jgi:hypothetical protein